MAICPLCKKDFVGVEPLENGEYGRSDLCPECVSDRFESDMARHRINRKSEIIERIKQIEKELPESDTPAKLRSERNDLNWELEMIKEAMDG